MASFDDLAFDSDSFDGGAFSLATADVVATAATLALSKTNVTVKAEIDENIAPTSGALSLTAINPTVDVTAAISLDNDAFATPSFSILSFSLEDSLDNTATVGVLSLTATNASIIAGANVSSGLDSLAIAATNTTITIGSGEAANNWWNDTWWQSPFWGTGWWADTGEIVLSTSPSLSLSATNASIASAVKFTAGTASLGLSSTDTSVSVGNNVPATSPLLSISPTAATVTLGFIVGSDSLTLSSTDTTVVGFAGNYNRDSIATITPNRTRRKVNYVMQAGGSEVVQLDFNPWAEDNGTITEVSWRLVDGSAQVSSELFANNLVQAFISASSEGTSTIEIKVVAGSNIYKTYIDLFVTDEDIDDYGIAS